MIVQPDFLDHFKTTMLCDMLCDQCAPLYLIRLWGHCQSRKTHEFDWVSPLRLKAICKAPHDAVKFQEAMVESGYVIIENGKTIAHDWDDVNASLIANWERGKKGVAARRAKVGIDPKSTPSKPQVERDDNSGETPAGPSREEKIRLEEIEKKRLEKAERLTAWFEIIWTMYGKKGTRATALGRWLKLSEENRTEIEERIPAYVASTPDKEFRKNLEGWINPSKKMWLNEIVNKTTANHKKVEAEKDYSEGW